MKSSSIVRNDRLRSRSVAACNHRYALLVGQVALWGRFAQRGLLSLMFLAVCSHVQAQDFDQPDSNETPWIVLSTTPYLADASFNQGLYKVTNIAGHNSNSKLGRKIVSLSNGDVVVAGVSPRYLANFGDPLINILLTRYNSAGQIVFWTNPGANGFDFNRYVVFPNSVDAASLNNVKDVLDIKVHGDRIFVLVDRRYNGSDSDIDSRILVFGTDGAFLGSTTVLNTAKPEYSGGMVIYKDSFTPETLTILVTASTFDGVWRPTLIKGTVFANSLISLNAPVFPNPGNYCPTNRGCILRSITVQAYNSDLGPFYLAGARQSAIPDNGNWDFLVMSVTSDGNPFSNFGNSGVTTVAFENGGNNYDDARSIEIRRNPQSNIEIYVTGVVDMACKDGVGIVKMNHNGVLDTSFGGSNSGKIIIGGANPPSGGTCAQLFRPTATYANDATLTSGKLAIAGFSVSPRVCVVGQTCPEDDVDGMIAVIDGDHGNVDSFRTYPYTETVNGPRLRHSGFWGITDSGNDRFTATGDVRYFESATGQVAGVMQYATLRVASDGIFANRFE